ncbi:HD-GYP domain-containing protein [Terriglobus tenax]|uniref:HD-GYP domain-containing protein n=1 Tax=Terriglobus tenax TaxID=1111115 RepID=UPI0021DF96C7|nr:HD domain-containing phosphohydrolase [Terriglobus tenax]
MALHDKQAYRHSLLVAEITGAFAATIGLSSRAQKHLVRAALLHDVGKMEVPVDLLNKPGRLTEGELRIVHSHAERGYRMLLETEMFSPDILDIVLHHHEKLDGSGYPAGLRGRSVRNVVRMVTICDIYAALIEPRAYRASLSSQKALEIMVGMSDGLDRDLFDIFRLLAPRWTNIPIGLLFLLA